jgi:hypothetical protein
MNKQLIQQFLDQSCYDEQDKRELEDWCNVEKFAELIVKECLAQVDKVDAILEDDTEKIGVAWVGLAIAKHFGIKE